MRHLALLLSLGFAGCCCVPWPFDEDEPAEPSADRPRDKAKTKAKARRAGDPIPAVAPPDALGAPGDSVAAKPDWWNGSGYAPQPSADAMSALTPANALSGTLRGALLDCRVVVEGFDEGKRFQFGRKTFDFSSPDLLTYLSFGSSIGEAGQQAISRGSNNTSAMRIRASLVDLERGDPVSVSVYDRSGLFRKKLLVALDGEYGGSLPLTLSSESITAECQAAPREQIEAALPALMRSVDQEIASFVGGYQPDMEASDFGRLAFAPSAGDALGRDVAALVGWHDPRVQPRVARIDAALAAFEDDLAQALAAQLAQSVPAGQAAPLKSGLSLRVTSAGCGAQPAEAPAAQEAARKMGCAAILELRNDGANAVTSEFGRLGPIRDLDAVAPDGETATLIFEGRVAGGSQTEDGDVIFPPGEAVTVAYGYSEESAQMIRVGVEAHDVFSRTWRWLRLP